jgi:hypothetical protein
VQVVAAMNSCPCGYELSIKRKCTCKGEHRARYQKRIEWFIQSLEDSDRGLEIIEVPDVWFNRNKQGAQRV